MFNFLECRMLSSFCSGHRQDITEHAFVGVSLGVVWRLRRVLRHDEVKSWQAEGRAGPGTALLLPRPALCPLFQTGMSPILPVLQRQRLQREGLTHGAGAPVVFSNSNSFCGI